MNSSLENSTYINSKFILEELSTYQITFGLKSDVFFICISSYGNLLFFKSIHISHSNSTTNYENIEKELKSLEFFDSLRNCKIELLIGDEFATFIPNEVFQDAEPKKYLQLLNNVEIKEFASQTLENNKAHCVFGVDNETISLIKSHFNIVSVKHNAPILVDFLMKNAMFYQDDFHLKINQNSFEVFVIKNRKFTFFNIFKFHNAEELIYYILAVAKQLEIDREKVELQISGNVLKSSKLIELLSKYFRNIDIVGFNNDIQVSENTQKIFHPFFIGFSK